MKSFYGNTADYKVNLYTVFQALKFSKLYC